MSPKATQGGMPNKSYAISPEAVDILWKTGQMGSGTPDKLCGSIQQFTLVYEGILNTERCVGEISPLKVMKMTMNFLNLQNVKQKHEPVKILGMYAQYKTQALGKALQSTDVSFKYV